MPTRESCARGIINTCGILASLGFIAESAMLLNHANTPGDALDQADQEYGISVVSIMLMLTSLTCCIMSCLLLREVNDLNRDNLDNNNVAILIDGVNLNPEGGNEVRIPIANIVEDERLQLANLVAANSALLERIDGLLYDQLDQDLLHDNELLETGEIEAFKELVAEYPEPDAQEQRASLKSYDDSLNCEISYDTIYKPVTVTADYNDIEGVRDRAWAKTYDAEILKTFISRCSTDGKKAFAIHSPSDYLDDRHITFKGVYGATTISVIFSVREMLWNESRKKLENIRNQIHRFFAHSKNPKFEEMQESLLPFKLSA